MRMKRIAFLYYSLLVLILALYTNMSGSPNLIFRLAYLAALVLPLFNHLELIPVVIICTLGISKNTFAYPFMPTENIYYVFLAFVFALLSFARNRRITIPLFYFFASIFVFLNDLLFQYHFSQLSISLIIFLLFSICADTDREITCKYLPYAFITISLVLSYWILFCENARINVYNTVDDLEQIGWMDPNYLGCVLGTGLILSVREMLQDKKTSYYIVLLSLTIVVSLLALLSLGSRGSIISVVVSVVLLVLFSRVRPGVKLGIFIFSGIVVLLLYSNQYLDLVIARFQTAEWTGSHRTEIWVSKLEAFFSNASIKNLLFGYGQEGGFSLGDYKISALGTSTHNDFVASLIYYGLTGALFFLYSLFYPIKKSTKQMRPQVIALLTYLVMCSMTIEPLAHGNIVYIAFFFYVIQLARQSQTTC